MQKWRYFHVETALRLPWNQHFISIWWGLEVLKNGDNLYRKEDVLEVMFLFDIFEDMTCSHSFASFETIDFAKRWYSYS